MSNIKKQFGFTLVELLIVIVVISILTAITVVSFTGIQQRAANTARTSDMMQVNKLLTLYKATFDIYPAMSATVGAYYCVGTGYANNQCHYSTPESDKTVTNELLKISSSLPNSSVRQQRIGFDVGPYIEVISGGFQLVGVFDGKNNCPTNTTIDYYDTASGKQHCRITYMR